MYICVYIESRRRQKAASGQLAGTIFLRHILFRRRLYTMIPTNYIAITIAITITITVTVTVTVTVTIITATIIPTYNCTTSTSNSTIFLRHIMFRRPTFSP